MGLLIRSSKIHAAGCFTTAPLPKGAYIVEYTGELITAVEADRRYADSDHTLLFGLSDGETVIDGRGLAAFINHSCEPNCEPDEIDGRIWIVALRDIAASEELTYDYNLYDGDGHAPCNCGAKHCRGTMYQIDSPKRRRRGRGGNKTKRKKTARRRNAA